MLDKKLIFIQSTYGDAHQMIRFIELRKHYNESVLLAFERTYYETTRKIDYVRLGTVENGNLAGRILVYLKALKIIFKNVSGTKGSDIYFYGFDLLPLIVLANVFRQCRLIFEIPDLRAPFFEDKISTKILLKVLRVSMKKIPKTVVTSELFVTGFLRNNSFQTGPYFVLENKVHLEDNTLPVRMENSEIVIGYFGVIRCEQSLKILLEFLEVSHGYRLIIYGIFSGISDHQKALMLSHPKVNYKGEYKSPEDLREIYAQIDISWVAYPYSAGKKEGNFKYARTNRYYEAGFFRIPMIGNQFAGDARFIEEFDYGITLDLGNMMESVEDMKKISPEKLESWKANLRKAPVSDFMSTDEDYFPLLESLKGEG